MNKLFDSFFGSEGHSFEYMARVDQPINGYYSGRIYFQGTYWPAKFQKPQIQIRANHGELVNVVGREGLTLIVNPQ